MPQSVKVVNGALEETPKGDVILRGVVDPDSLRNLQVASYQREILSAKKVDAIRRALEAGSTVPDIVLGMRGQRVREREFNFFLQDRVFIVDGLQRTTAALAILDAQDTPLPNLGAKVHFGTDETMERRMFEALNLGQTRLNGNVILRNKTVEVDAMEALFKLTESRSFALYRKVSWKQNMVVGNLITAITYIKVSAMLHSHAGPGRSSDVIDMVNGIEKIMDNLGRATLVSNVRTFFDIVDKSYGFSRVSYRHGASFIKSQFLLQLAKVLSDHSNFWKDGRLVVDRQTIEKLKQFPIDDPNVSNLASSGGSAGEILYQLIVNHINSGRRTRRLQLRRPLQDTPEVGFEDEVDEES